MSLDSFIKFMILVSSRAESSSLWLTVYDACNTARVTHSSSRLSSVGHKPAIVEVFFHPTTFKYSVKAPSLLS